MRVAYLINRYPAPSHSFIRREIKALEANGVTVWRFSVRRSDKSQLADPRDQEELDKTIALLDLGTLRLLWRSVLLLLSQPARALNGLRIAFAQCPWRPPDVIRRSAYFAEAAQLTKELGSRKIGHIHAHFGTNSTMVARITSVLSGVPYSFTAHGPDEFDSPKQLDLAGKIRDAKFCIAISSFGRSQLMRWSAFEDWPKIMVVRCGVDENFIDRAGKIEPPTAPVLCAVARLSGQKGIPLLLEAAAELKRRGQKFELRLIGDGEMRQQVEAIIASLELSENVVLVGWADTSAVIAHLQASRAMVLPSFAEGLPVVIMEALALGRPVVVSAIAGVPELVDAGCGWLVPAGSVDGLVRALEDALQTAPHELAAMGEVGRARVCRDHDSRENGRQLARLIRDERLPYG